MALRKVLGSANYAAVRSPHSGIISLTANGILPCYNYVAQLEMRPERIFPPMWNLVFLVEQVCIRAVKPFEYTVHMGGEGTVVRVLDAKGWQDIPITDPFVPALRGDSLPNAAFEVYAQLPAPSDEGMGHHNCIKVPAGSIVLAIYYRAFGPASETECDEWMGKNCQRSVTEGGDVVWPAVPDPE